MKPTLPVVSSSRFARYATASAAAMGAAAAHAQFSGAYSLTSPTPAGGSYSSLADNTTFGAWTAHVSGIGSASINTTFADGSNFFSMAVSSPGNFSLILTDPLATDSYVTFHWGSFNTVTGGPVTFAFSDNFGVSSFITLHTGSGYLNGDANFLVTAGNQFGFRLSASYIGESSNLNISSFAVTAVPEPASAGLLMGCAGIGFIALMGVREMRRRAAAKLVA